MDSQQALLALTEWLYETKDEPLEAMASFFERRIDSYEEHMSPWRDHYGWMAELLPRSTETLLDIGCGTGLELDRIFETMPDLSVTGIDMSGKMLSTLKRKHTDKALTLIEDDYFAHELGENRFDAAISFETLHHFTMKKKTALYEKLFRALKPGGTYLECDYIAVSQEIEDLLFDEFARRRRRDGIPSDAYVHFDTPLTLEHELKAMRDAGFEVVELVGFLPEDDHTAMIRAGK